MHRKTDRATYIYENTNNKYGRETRKNNLLSPKQRSLLPVHSIRATVPPTGPAYILFFVSVSASQTEYTIMNANRRYICNYHRSIFFCLVIILQSYSVECVLKWKNFFFFSTLNFKFFFRYFFI